MSRTETYIGAGVMYLRRRNDPTAKTLSVGNLSKLSLEWDTETKKLANYQSQAGGTFDAYTDIRGGKLSFELTQYFPHNIAMMVYGSQEEIDEYNSIQEGLAELASVLGEKKAKLKRS